MDIPKKYDLEWWFKFHKKYKSSLTGISMREFNLLHRSSQHIVFECEDWESFTRNTIPLYCALSLASEKRLFLWYNNPRIGMETTSIYQDIVPYARQHLEGNYRTFQTPIFLLKYLKDDFEDYAPDLIVIPCRNPGASPDGLVENIVCTVDQGMKRSGRRTRVIVFIERSKESGKWLDVFKKSHKDGYLYMDYPRERQIVDDFYKNAASRTDVDDMFLVDPVFDMMLMKPGLDLGLVYSYLATSHAYDFLDYATFNKDEVAKHMRKEELRHYVRKHPKWEKS